jgi:hypothetical protein
MTVAREDQAASDEPSLEPIDREECLRLMRAQVIGRVAVADFNAAPLVVPVNFVVDGEAVVFRCDYGTKFRLAVLGEQPVSFEVDGLDPGRRSGWSVLLQGDASEIDRFQLAGPGPQSWAGGKKAHWVRIFPVSITGRRIRLPDLFPSDGAGYL